MAFHQGGLGRLDPKVSSSLIEGAKNESLDIQSVKEILARCIWMIRRFCSIHWGRMPLGLRLVGSEYQESTREYGAFKRS